MTGEVRGESPDACQAGKRFYRHAKSGLLPGRAGVGGKLWMLCNNRAENVAQGSYGQTGEGRVWIAVGSFRGARLRA